MNLWQALILGIVEGITEFLPISSTGHLILTAHLIGLTQTEYLKTFEIAIQLGAILSVVVLYWRSLLVNFEIMKRVAAAFIPTAVFGLIFYKLIKKYLMAGHQLVLWTLLIGGFLLILFEWLHREKDDAMDEIAKMPYWKAAAIGVFQSIAMIPGVSRSAATILGGLFLGIRRKAIVEFSFLLAVPTMLAATVLDLLKSAGDFSSDQALSLGVGFLTSFVVAIFSIKFLLSFIKSHNFIPFGIYRILAAVAFWLIVR